METLPKGLRLDKGYLQIRIFSDGRSYCENFGRDTPESREIAIIRLNDLRKQLSLWRAKLLPKHPFEREIKFEAKRFNEAAAIWLDKWSRQTNPNGQLKHSESSIANTKGVIAGSLNPFFGKIRFDAIRPKEIKAWRTLRGQFVAGTSVNREQVVLSSIFSHTRDWIATEDIRAFKQPTDPQTGNVWNPCLLVEKATTVKRDRILTEYEISKLKNAFKVLGDESGLETICLALKTCLNEIDLKKLKFGDMVDLSRSKTAVPVAIPILVNYRPNWKNWRKRWETARAAAGLTDVEFRDLRKSGGNLLLGHFDDKLISQYHGHASLKTTEDFYNKIRSEKLRPLAEFMSKKIDSL